jgi:shikimate kinase
MNNYILFGMKNSGKSTLSDKIASQMNKKVIHIDDLFTDFYQPVYQERLSFREIHKKHGPDFFRNFETNVVRILHDFSLTDIVVDCGGGTPMREENRELLRHMGTLVWLKVDQKVNYERIIQNGIPSFFKYQDDPRRSFEELVEQRYPVYKDLADITVDVKDEDPDAVFAVFEKSIFH